MVIPPATIIKIRAVPKYPIPAASPRAMARNMLPISLALPGMDLNRTRLNAPMTATLVPRFPFTSMITVWTMTGSSTRVRMKLLEYRFLYVWTTASTAPSRTDVTVQSKNCPIVIPAFTVSVNTLSSTDSSSLHKHAVIQVLFIIGSVF